jgi:hypothetical protein
MKKVFLAMILSLIFMVGCVAVETTTGKDFDSAKVSQIQIGKTTQSEILTMFGYPAWRYDYQTTRSTGTLSPQEQTIKPLVNEKTLTVIFKDGVVKDFTFFEN